MQLMKNKCPMTKVNHLEQACFKGSVSRDLLPFFHDMNPSGIFDYLAQIFESDSAVCIGPQSQSLQSALHHRVKKTKCLNSCDASYLRVKLCGVMHTTESALSNFLIVYSVQTAVV